ncbi:hypothetical protein LCGC14_1182750 [marine sediment metagenome]|uniref:Uncharacterized protein n=1 Tax=marine sediment metagenome TaxID=412755 RepID=A0A0F9PS53_9ZZZZ
MATASESMAKMAAEGSQDGCLPDSQGGKKVDGRTMATRTDPYPLDIKAEAIALVYETGTFTQAGRVMAERYPERHPNFSNISRWFKQLDPERWKEMGEEREETFKAGIMEVGVQAVSRLSDSLSTLSDAQVPITSGITIDKALELLKLQKGGGNQMNVQFNLVTRE